MSGRVETERVGADEAGARLDRWVKRRLQLSQGEVEKLLRTGQIRVDGGRARANMRLETGMTVRLPPVAKDKRRPPETAPDDAAKLTPQERDFIRALVVYEDEELIALNKPAGLAVQGGTRQRRHIDGLLGGLVKDGHRPRLVHRLDKETSGLLLLARTPASAARLGDLFRSRDMAKVYWAVTVGVPSPRDGEVRGWMVKGRGAGDARERMHAARHGDPDARHAVTHYAVISTAGQKAAWVALKPETGRMHQLRFHMAELGTAILGDRKYATRREVPQGVAPGLHLHARALVIPRKRRRPLTLSAPLPAHMAETFETLGFIEAEAGGDPLAPFE